MGVTPYIQQLGGYTEPFGDRDCLARGNANDERIVRAVPRSYPETEAPEGGHPQRALPACHLGSTASGHDVPCPLGTVFAPYTTTEPFWEVGPGTFFGPSPRYCQGLDMQRSFFSCFAGFGVNQRPLPANIRNASSLAPLRWIVTPKGSCRHAQAREFRWHAFCYCPDRNTRAA